VNKVIAKILGNWLKLNLIQRKPGSSLVISFRKCTFLLLWSYFIFS